MPAKDRRRLGAAARITLAERKAEQVLVEFGFSELPIPVDRLAMRLGLDVERAVLGDDISGLLVIQEGRGIIGINASQASTRQRFTIAHELGHFVLHRDIVPVFIDKQFLKPYVAAFRDGASATGEEEIEREANAFAAGLLMPANLVHEAARLLPPTSTDDDVIEGLARRFDVSRQAMSFRLANLTSGRIRSTNT
jgi:Zn-dependent peptidase ImmA (M78 family)